MIIDSNAIFFDSKKLSELKSATESDPVGLTSLHRPGMAEPVAVAVRISSDTTGLTGLTVLVQQSDTEKGTYKDVDGTVLEMDNGADGALAAGKDVGWRFLPRHITKPWIKLKVTATGASAGTLFAAVVREDEIPYGEGMYIDKGVVLG